MLYGHEIDYLKCTNNTLAQFLRYLLFYMKPDTINIIISGIVDIITLKKNNLFDLFISTTTQFIS